MSNDGDLGEPTMLTFFGVDTKMTIVVHGDIVLLFTSQDEQFVDVDTMMGAGRVPGRPMELTHEQTRDLAHFLLAAVTAPGPHAPGP